MCTYSMVHDWAQTIPLDTWTRPLFSEYQELIRRLEEIDKKLNLPECNPNKGEFIKEIEKRLDRLEKTIGLSDNG